MQQHSHTQKPIKKQLTDSVSPKSTEDSVVNSTGVYSIEVKSNKFLPYIAKGNIATIDPDLPTSGRNCLVRLNSEYLFMKHKLHDGVFYLYSLDGSENSLPITSKLDFQILGVVTRITEILEG